MSSLIYILSGTGHRVRKVLFGSLRTALPYLFSMLWPLIVIWLFGKSYWGDCVDALLIVNVITLIVGWGTGKHLLKKFDLLPANINDAWLENLHNRFAILACFILLVIFSPFSLLMKIGILMLIIGKYFYVTYEPVIEYKHRYGIAIGAEMIGFISGFSMLYIINKEIANEHIIFSMGVGELVRNVLLIILMKDVKIQMRFRFFRPGFYIQAYPFFMLSFASIFIHMVDRVFVYTNFNNEIKAEYQIYMNFLLFLISFPNFLLMPFFKNYYKSKIQLSSGNHILLIVLGALITPFFLWLVWLLCKHFYQFDVSWNFLITGMLFVFPSFIYYPFTLRLISRNKQLGLSFVMFILSVLLVFLCYYMIDVYGLSGALYAATIGQWGLLVMILILNMQEQSERKIKFIK